MQRLKAVKERCAQLALRAAERAGEFTQRSAIKLADALQERSSQLRHGETGQRLADSVLKAGEQVIDKSPLPVPVIVRDALGRMQDALGQLGNAIEALDSGAGADAAKDVAAIKQGSKGRQHFVGKVAPSDAAEAAGFTSSSHGRKDKHGHHKHTKV